MRRMPALRNPGARNEMLEELAELRNRADRACDDARRASIEYQRILGWITASNPASQDDPF